MEDKSRRALRRGCPSRYRCSRRRSLVTTRRLIEEELPLEAVNAASAREKSLRHGNISTMHLWWARRPLAMSRAVVLGTLLPDVGDDGHRQRILKHIAAASEF